MEVDIVICKSCNKNIPEESIYCMYCGNKIEKINADEVLIAACKNCVTERLKAPSTANFPTIEIKDKDDYGRIFYYVEVDSQNSFGATIRTKIYVVLQHVNDDGTFKALDTAVYKVSFINTEDVVKRVNKWNRPI